MPQDPARHKIAVLLATYNGAPWLHQQVQSILAQRDVMPIIYASDDCSSDATPQILSEYAAAGSIRWVGPSCERFGNANRNFLRLIAEAPLHDESHVAFSDQDDVWLADKLARAVRLLQSREADAYSSNVAAFWPNGKERVSRKAQPQRQYDHLFESSGPGCTFVLPRHRFDELRKWLLQHWEEARCLRVHDWLIYAFARARGWHWFIDSASTVRYRQHGGNERGINEGWRAARIRWREATSGLYIQEVRAYQRVLGCRTPYDLLMDRLNLFDRLRLALAVRHFRRRRRDQFVLASMFLTMRRSRR